MQIKDLRYYLTVYAFNLAKRKTEKERQSFFRIVGNIFMNLGYSCRIQSKRQAGNTVQNFIAGNLENADTVYIGIYDNPVRMLLPRPRYYPLDMQKNKTAEILNVMLNLILIALAAGSLVAVLQLTQNLSDALRTFLVAVTAVGLIALYSLTAGKPAYPNFSRNASLALLTMLASKRKEKTAYVLCDMSAASLLGFQVLLEEHSFLKRKKVIVFDSMGQDEVLLIAANEKTQYAAQTLKKQIANPNCEVVAPEPGSYSVLSLFTEAILLSFCHKDDQGEYHVENLRTKHDNKVDIERLQSIYEAF